MKKGILGLFNHALETRKHSQESVRAGREYVKVYVTYTHYVEGVVQVVGCKGHGAEAAPRQLTANTHQNGLGTLAGVPDPTQGDQ